MVQRKTIGDNPIAAAKSAAAAEPLQQDRVTTKKQAVTIHMNPDVIDRARDAVYWTPGLTLAELAETALTETIEALEAKRGEPFPKRSSELKTGRPVR